MVLRIITELQFPQTIGEIAGSLWMSHGNCSAIVLEKRYRFPPLIPFDFRPPITAHLVRPKQRKWGRGMLKGLLPSDTFAFAGQAFCVIVLLLRRPSPSWDVRSQNEKQHSQPHRTHDKVLSTTNVCLQTNFWQTAGPFNSEGVGGNFNLA